MIPHTGETRVGYSRDQPMRAVTSSGKMSCIQEYNYLVRVKTSITLPSDLLKSIDQADSNRSAFIERAARSYLARIRKAEREAKDIEIINANAERLNQEAADVLDYQGLP